MKILFDQDTPAPLRRFLGSHTVVTAYELGWSEFRNGDLINAAENPRPGPEAPDAHWVGTPSQGVRIGIRD